MKLQRSESLLFIATSLILGAVTDVLVRQEITGINFVVLTFIWLIIGLAALLKKKRLTIRPLVYALYIVVNALLVYVRVEPIVQVWSIVTVIVFMMLLYTNAFLVNFNELSLLNRIFEYIAGSITTFFMAISAVYRSLVGKEQSKVTTKISIGAVIAVPLVLLFIGLFSSSDQVFSSNFSWLGDALPSFVDWLASFNIGRGITITFWALVAFGGISFVMRASYTSSLKNTQIHKSLPARDATIITASVVGVFALFVVIQLRYLFAGASLPDGITYADYARKGYGELLLATAIASALVYIVHTTAKQERRINLYLETVLLVSNFLVVVSAWKRLSLYESAYGYTMTRFVARIGLICIVFGIASLLLWLLKRLTTGRLFASNWYVLASVLTVSALFNPIGIITTQNITERTSRAVPLDTNHLIQQSADSLPSICKNAHVLQAEFVDEYSALAQRRETFTSDGYQITTYDKPNENAVRQTNMGLSAHYTKSKSYIDKYLYCLQK